MRQHLRSIFDGLYPFLLAGFLELANGWVQVITGVIGVGSAILIGRYYYYKGNNEKREFEEGED